MNFLEALNTGKKIRRPQWTNGFYYQNLGPKGVLMGGDSGVKLYKDDGFAIGDVLATDWEVVEEKVPLTRAQAFSLYKEGLMDACRYKSNDHSFKPSIQKLMEQFGFKGDE